MQGSKRPERERENAWADTKTAVRAYTKNPCAATEQAVSTALGKVRDLPPCLPAVQKQRTDKQGE